MNAKDIHFCKAAFKAPFATALDANKLSIDKYFKKVNIPLITLDPEELIPEKPFWKLVNLVAVEENIPDFGLQVAHKAPWHEIDSLKPLLYQSSTLKELLDTFCKVASSQSSMVEFFIEEKEDHFYFRYIGEPLYKNDIQMELYRLTCMIQLVQLSTGKQWSPIAISLMMKPNTMINPIVMFKHSQLQFNNPFTSISIEKNLMHLPVYISIPDKPCQSSADINIDTDFANAIRIILSSYIKDGGCSIDKVAEIAGITVRTMQRRLKDYDLKFNDLLNQARFIYASQQLENTNIPINQIAQTLDYSDAANFTRAFQRWAGVSPTEYRASLSEKSKNHSKSIS